MMWQISPPTIIVENYVKLIEQFPQFYHFFRRCFSLFTAFHYPNISEAPNQGEGCLLWRIIEDSAPEKYYLTPYLCTKYLRMAKKAGCRFPEPVEAVLLKQGGRMQK